MKKIFIYPILLLSLLFTSCDWLDVNKDPNTATDVSPDVLFNYGIVSWAANRASGDLYLPLGFAGQTLATGGSTGWGDLNVYLFSEYSLGNTWKAFYASGGANFKQAIALAEEANKPNTAAQIKIAFAELMYSATTLYGDIPYSEAWDLNTTLYPKFDSQKDILDNLLALLDEAKSQIDPSSLDAMVDYDLAYKGNMDKWTRYANSLKFKIAMLMVDKDPSKATLIGALLSENNMVNSAANNYFYPFENVTVNSNPRYKILYKYYNGKNLDFYANKNVLDPLKASNDPRLSRYFDAGNSATLNPNKEYFGLDTNEDGVYGLNAMISAYLYRIDAPELFYSYQEQLFFEAEAYARGLGVAVDLNKANDKYKEALKQAMLYYGADQASIDVYFANDFKSLSSVADPVKEIHLQQWIDLMDRPLDAFTQWRRSGKEGQEVPALTVPRNAAPAILFRKWEYSPDEMSANPNAPKGDNMLNKVWFDE